MKQNWINVALFGAITFTSAAFAETPTESIVLDEIVVTATRFKDSSTDQPLNVQVISRAEIQQSSARTLPELLALQAGISMRDLYGNNAAGSTVDMRGFGAAAGSNTLILLDGRRITDIDISGVQWAAIPFSAIERVEILRGSGAVLYGDGATSGVINIITRTPTQQGKKGELSVRSGSYGMTEVQANGSYFSGVAGLDVTASQLDSKGYRANNRDEQTNFQAKFRRIAGAGELVAKLDVDHQVIRFPGTRTVQPSAGIDQVASDPRGTSTPLDYASRDGNQIGLEWQQTLGKAEFNFSVSRREKNQKSYFDFGGFPDYRDADLSVNSFTPRVRLPHSLGGDSSLVMGLDVHRWSYDLRKSNAEANIAQPVNRVAMTERNQALYVQNTTRLSAATTLLAGVRNERIEMNGADVYDATAPGVFFGSAAPAASFANTQNAYELALRHQLASSLSINGKIGRGFRFANVDEVYESDATFSNQFQFLKPQITDSVELSVSQQMQASSWRAAAFSNKVADEIHLDPFSSGVGNTNLPPSRRQGIELEGKWQAIQNLALNATYGYTDARFLSGVLPGGGLNVNVNIAGKHVPLVASHKLNLGAAWALSEQTKLNTSMSYVSSQFMENDEANTLGAKIPAYLLTDVKLVHRIGALQLNGSVNNLFDRKYFNYAVSSQFAAGKYNAYTLPGRTIYLGLSYAM